MNKPCLCLSLEMISKTITHSIVAQTLPPYLQEVMQKWKNCILFHCYPNLWLEHVKFSSINSSKEILLKFYSLEEAQQYLFE